MTFEQNVITKTYKPMNLGENILNVQAKIDAEDVKSVLFVCCKPYVKTNDVVGSNVSANGTATFEVAYTNGTNETMFATTTANFSTLFDTKNGSNFVFEAKSTNADAQIVGNEILLESKVAVGASALLGNEILAVKPGTEGAFELVKNIGVQSLCAVCDDKIVVVDESEISATKILGTETVCNITKTTPIEDAVLVSGEILFSILSELDGSIKSTCKTVEFSSEVSALGIKPNAVICPFANIETCVASLGEGGANAALTTSATIKFDAYCFDETVVAVVEDAFSDSVDLLTTTTGFENHTFVEKTYKKEMLAFDISTKDKTINMGSLMAVVNPKILESAKGATLEATAIFKDAETDEIETCVLSGAIKDEFGNCNIITAFTKKKAKEVEIELATILEQKSETETFETYVSEIEERGEIERDNHAIVVYSARKGQSLFSVAKALKVSPETLKEQNANLAETFETDKKVVLFRRNMANF